MIKAFKALVAFYRDIHERKDQIKGGLKQFALGSFLAIAPGLVAMVVFGFGIPLPDIGGYGPPIALAAALGYGFVWFPYFIAFAANSRTAIFGKRASKALGEARFATRKDMLKHGLIGGSPRTNVYLGRRQ